jgi:hypothetical protein
MPVDHDVAVDSPTMVVVHNPEAVSTIGRSYLPVPHCKRIVLVSNCSQYSVSTDSCRRSFSRAYTRIAMIVPVARRQSVAVVPVTVLFVSADVV